MPVFTFPRRIYFQRDIVDSLGEILEGSERVLIISDRNVFGLYGSRIMKSMQGKNVEIFTDVLPEPSVESVESAFRRLKGLGFDAVVAVGGGSVIDFAKSIALKLSYPEMDLRDVNPFIKIPPKVRLVAVPTTSGTGSDASFGIVLTDKDRKIALGNYDLVPEISVLDSSLTPDSKEIIRATGVDALVHAFEAISANTSSILTDALAEKAIETIFKNLKPAMENKEEAKDLIHLAATMAGMAFSNSGTALAHALGHSFGSTFHVVHGTSVGLFLPYVIGFNSGDERTREKYGKLARVIGCEDLIECVKGFFADIKQPIHVKELGINREEYVSRMDELVQKAMMDSELAFNPVIVGEEDVRAIFLMAYGD